MMRVFSFRVRVIFMGRWIRGIQHVSRPKLSFYDQWNWKLTIFNGLSWNQNTLRSYQSHHTFIWYEKKTATMFDHRKKIAQCTHNMFHFFYVTADKLQMRFNFMVFACNNTFYYDHKTTFYIFLLSCLQR